MPNPWKSKVLTFNRKRAEEGEKSEDLMTLLDALPPGQVKNLLKDETCAAILSKYGITGK
jgi:hypothetical protein